MRNYDKEICAGCGEAFRESERRIIQYPPGTKPGESVLGSACTFWHRRCLQTFENAKASQAATGAAELVPLAEATEGAPETPRCPFCGNILNLCPPLCTARKKVAVALLGSEVMEIREVLAAWLARFGKVNAYEAKMRSETLMGVLRKLDVARPNVGADEWESPYMAARVAVLMAELPANTMVKFEPVYGQQHRVVGHYHTGDAVVLNAHTRGAGKP